MELEPIQRKSFELIEVKAGDDARTIEGFGSVFNNVDFGGDIVMPGAFAKTIKRRKAIPMLWQHDTSLPIGKWTDFEETDKGLFIKGTISDTALGRDAHTLALDGAITGMSIGYTTEKYEIDQGKGTRKLVEIKLHEISLVTFAMNEKATITGVKAMPTTLREFEEFLREEGKFSREDATTIALRGFKALNTEREAGAGDAELVNLLKQFKS